ncbi:antitoxin [Canibacter sp. lx-72]|uniref:Rv0909 family putative TA system antitoxin n=1 Tax=Canibacter zhuwentaonis TaxID=2837491 RepID=UPI001BDD4D6E|nr:Rv0909 family putative TA system antitoxin [Canibacter zhuwentaonis]MBT1018315.1 antitoxin [Canibacter zhuwentaonis]
MSLEDLKKKAADLINDNKEQIDNALNSEKAAEMRDGVLDKAASLANKITDGKHADKVAELKEAASEKLDAARDNFTA